MGAPGGQTAGGPGALWPTDALQGSVPRRPVSRFPPYAGCTCVGRVPPQAPVLGVAFSRPAAASASADPEKESAQICRERKRHGEVSCHDFRIFLVLFNIEVERPQNSRVESEPIRSPFHPT